jgi:hypothetical protein
MEWLRKAGTTAKTVGGAGILGMARPILLACTRNVELPRGK